MDATVTFMDATVTFMGAGPHGTICLVSCAFCLRAHYAKPGTDIAHTVVCGIALRKERGARWTYQQYSPSAVGDPAKRVSTDSHAAVHIQKQVQILRQQY
eukprot:1372238-Rhodomonas_salina.3